MELDPEICERARLARDARFDGRFFIGVKTTGIYCRPICPVRPPKAENVRFYPTAAAAAEAGFRPCLRCRPEAAPGSPAWFGTAATVSRGLRLIGEGALDGDGTVERLAGRLGVGARHLSRLFRRHLGAPPRAVAGTRRLQFAKKLINETELPLAEIALSSGFGSIRRFNAAFLGSYGCPPSALRRAPVRRKTGEAGGDFVLRLPYRTPFDWHFLADYFALRATPGVEAVDRQGYRRTIALDGQAGQIHIRPVAGENALMLQVMLPDSRSLFAVVERVRRLFDLAADPDDIAAHLGRDPDLAPVVAAHPGLRLPGAWDGFELAVRAILGQQVTVKGASTLAGRLAAAFGERLPVADGPAILFPTPAALAEADVGAIGLPKARARTIRALAGAVRSGAVTFDAALDPGTLEDRLTALPGIGGWTAQYVAMRALNEPDAFPATDLGLIRSAAALGMAANAKALAARAEAWRPWRAYAAQYLWRAGAAGRPAPPGVAASAPRRKEKGVVLQPHG
ncbi:MAG: DNA-3-methyladenine glycosylase 2 family protein [Inquilinus sp.]|nr:DNA-3-methyladenine glycosylase 2 family protein [Inquilinus sp.]